MSKTTAAEKNDLAGLIEASWKVADAADVLEILHPKDITVQRYAERHDISDSHARTILEKLVKEGKFVRVKCREPDKAGMVMAYRKKAA